MIYEEKTYEEIFEEVLQDSLEKGLISHAEDFPNYIANNQDISNYYVMDKSVIAQMIATVYERMTEVYESKKVEYAEGTDLDDIGKIVGVPRPEATYAEVICTFSLREALPVEEGNVQIPPGVHISTLSGIEYVTIEEIFIANGDTLARVSARASEAGIASKIIENTLVRIDDDLNYDLTVNNPSSSSGGTEAYTDDEYRYLLMHWKEIQLKGSDEAYLNYFANFDGIDSYNIIPNWDGSGTVKCVIDPGTDYQLNRAYDELSSSVVQETEDITMFAPTSKLIDIYAVVNVDIDQINPYSSVEKDIIQSKIIAAIKVFINGGYRVNGDWYDGLYLGEDFIPHKLAVFLDDEIPELKNITFTYPDDYIQISDDEIGTSNEITIEMI